ncbi:F0F1 ATP synthase subunit A, partial [Priestia megaterium]|nr:F0F1 ATP synthase subunit A [Priestia megaterium]
MEHGKLVEFLGLTFDLSSVMMVTVAAVIVF